MLIEKGADINVVGSHNNTALAAAASVGRKVYFIDSSLNLFYSIFHLFSLLFTGFEKLALILIEKGANVNAVDENDMPVLTFAAIKGKLDESIGRIRFFANH